MRENKKHGSWKKLLTVLLMVAIMATIANPISAEAKTKIKTVKPKAVRNITSNAYAKSVAKKVTTGTTRVYLDDDMVYDYCGYVKFVAPKTKTYTFTIGNLQHPANKKGDLLGHMTFWCPYGYKNTGLARFYVKAKDGKTVSLNIARPKPTGLYYARKTDRYYTSRSGGVKLKKGQVVYLEFYFHTYTFTKKRISVDLKIK